MKPEDTVETEITETEIVLERIADERMEEKIRRQKAQAEERLMQMLNAELEGYGNPAEDSGRYEFGGDEWIDSRTGEDTWRNWKTHRTGAD